MASVNVDVVVIGAGWTGLATAAALRHYGVRNFVLLEAGWEPGSFWEGNYDRIRLHTPWHSLPCDGGIALYSYPMFKSKRQVITYLQEYLNIHKLHPFVRFGEKVTCVRQLRQGSWLVDTQAEWGTRRYQCGYVAVCTSKLRVPYLPKVQGLEGFKGRVLHSREYRSGAAFGGQDVLVVGSGNSAAEICADLVEKGAGQVTMLVHGPRHFVPLPKLGLTAWLGWVMGKLTEESAFQDWQLEFQTEAFWKQVQYLDHMTAKLAVDMSAFGLDTPEIGFREGSVKTGRIGTFDQGAIAMMRSGRISVRRARLSSLGQEEVHLDDGGPPLRVDAVVMATGFQPALEEFLAEPERFLQRGQEGKGCGLSSLTPITDGRSRSTVDGSLFFVGFDQALNGGLAMGFWGWHCGFLVAQGLGLVEQGSSFSLEALPEKQHQIVRRRQLKRAAIATAVALIGRAAWSRL